MQAGSIPKPHRWIIRIVLTAIFGFFVIAITWCAWIYAQIEHFAQIDQAGAADAIAVFGAAEYDGRPSPVFRARLDHAAELFHHGVAPLLIVLGGDGGDEYSEGGVGRSYLMGIGIPESSIIAETKSKSTAESSRRLAAIARTNQFRRLVVVSDDTHLFRIHAICAANGLDVRTSPRPRVTVEGGGSDFDSITHEILSYTAWRLHME
ncbi:MAG TPA: YdcF family protein [Terracidiphilus sp.]|nr:YdcF family protein [Terracidiphilus sp.]